MKANRVWVSCIVAAVAALPSARAANGPAPKVTLLNAKTRQPLPLDYVFHPGDEIELTLEGPNVKSYGLRVLDGAKVSVSTPAQVSTKNVPPGTPLHFTIPQTYTASMKAAGALPYAIKVESDAADISEAYIPLGAAPDLKEPKLDLGFRFGVSGQRLDKTVPKISSVKLVHDDVRNESVLNFDVADNDFAQGSILVHPQPTSLDCEIKPAGATLNLGIVKLGKFAAFKHCVAKFRGETREDLFKDGFYVEVVDEAGNFDNHSMSAEMKPPKITKATITACPDDAETFTVRVNAPGTGTPMNVGLTEFRGTRALNLGASVVESRRVGDSLEFKVRRPQKQTPPEYNQWMTFFVNGQQFTLEYFERDNPLVGRRDGPPPTTCQVNELRLKATPVEDETVKPKNSVVHP